MSNNFRVGQKVVCIDDACLPGYKWGEGKPEVGKVYTVREIGLISFIDGSPCIRLEELYRPNARAHGVKHPDMPYMARRFRPAIERKTDISIFTKMLTKQTVKA